MISWRCLFFYCLSWIIFFTLGLAQPLIALPNSNGGDFFNSGLENVRQQNYQQALIDFTGAINLNDDLIGAAYSDRCLVNLQLENYLAAESDCIQALTYNQDNIEAYLNLGLAYYYLEDYQKAIANYQEVNQRDRQDYRAYYNQGLVHFALTDYQKAIADYNLALTSSYEMSAEQKALIYSDRGLSYMMSNNYPQAIIDLSQGIELDPSNETAYFNRGCVNHRQGNYLAAVEDFTQVLQINPTATQAYVNRALLHHQLGRSRAAFEDIETALHQYQTQGDNQAYQKALALKQVMIESSARKAVFT